MPRTKYKRFKAVEQVQEEVDEVKQIMYLNLDEVLQREANVTHLEALADNLMLHAEEFEETSKKVKFAMWLKDKKLSCGLFIIAVLIVVAIVTVVLMKPWELLPKGPSDQASPSPLGPPPATLAASKYAM